MLANAIQPANEDKVIIDLNDLPTSKEEGWQYTPLAKRLKQLSLTGHDGNVDIKGIDSQYIQRLDGESSGYTDCLSKYIKNNKKINNNNKLYYFSNNLNEEIIYVDIPQNTDIQEPIEISYKTETGSAFMPIVILNIADNSNVELIESFYNAQDCWVNALLIVNIGQNASLSHYRHAPSADAVITHVGALELMSKAQYSYNGLAGGEGKALYRQELAIDVNGDESKVDINTLNLLKDNEITDLSVTMNHISGGSVSHQNVKSIIDDKARGVFQGKVYVAKDAQQTNANQMSRAILLSRFAEMDTKPELEIYADDVECAHGATTGQMDKQQLFYLRSRGIPEKEAKALLLQAFAEELLEKFENEKFRDQAYNWLSNRLKDMQT